jgi:glyceraldehyde-3-phosphate dehydrogenase (NADP+)
MRELDAGVVHVNAAPLWRTDAMPFGGRRDSGFGREGVRYAVAEMTEMKTVVVHPS